MAKVNNKTKGFNSICRDLVYDNDLSDRARFLYVYMACKPESWEFYQDKTAEELGYKKDTLRKYLDELIERGWIVEDEKRNQGKFGVLEYTIEIERKHGENLPFRKKTVSEKNRNGKNQEQRDIDNISSKQSLSDKEEIENNKRLSNDNPKVDYPEDFSSFWKVYHEGSKQQAYKAWKKLTDKEREAAEKNVYFYITFCRRSGRKKKDVSTYLNQKGFKEDWSQVPDCYRPVDGDIGRVSGFKNYMVTKWTDLIYHRNPLTFEQCDRLIDEYGLKQFEWAMFRLCARDIHQYYSIKAGVETILKEEGDDGV